MEDGSNGWFYAKRYGYGAGLPRSWQGWLATALFLGGALAASLLLAPVSILAYVGVMIFLTSIFLLVAKRTPELRGAVDAGVAVGESVNHARDLVNAPPNDMNPPALADFAKARCDELGIDCKVWNKKGIEKLGMLRGCTQMLFVGLLGPIDIAAGVQLVAQHAPGRGVVRLSFQQAAQHGDRLVAAPVYRVLFRQADLVFRLG